MNRNSFLKIGLAVGSFLASPFALLAKFNKNRVNKGFKVDAGKDRFDNSISPFAGDTFYCKVSTKDTDGDLYVYESTRLRNGGPALHYHYEQDEFWYILKGEFIIKVGDEIYHAKQGDSVFGPRMVPHAFAKVGEGEAKLLMLFQPAGKMEAFFKALSEGITKDMTEDQRKQFTEEHGARVVGPPIEYQKM